MSPLARLFGIFWEPKRTFQDIINHPGFWLPLLLMVALGVVYIALFQQTVGVEELLRQQLAKQPNAQEIPPGQMGMVVTFTTVTMFVGAALGAPIAYAVIALILMFAFRILAGSEVKFKQAFGISVHAFLPTVITSVLAIIVMQTVRPADFDLQNPIMSNLGWLVDTEASAGWLYSLASSIDVFMLWIVVLLAMGFATATRKCSTGTGIAIVGSLWALVIVVKVGWSALFG
ncbi:MAG: hypothetical protein GY953_37415 [bacterium]|nr:hypothetical protein [bacterium]